MLPFEYTHKLAAETVPSMRWDGVEPLADWQARAREKLGELLGMDKMVPAELLVEIDFDKAGDEYREIRFRFQSEPGYYVPCHMLIPNGAAAPLNTVICMQGHSKGMHISLGRTKYEGEVVAGDRDFCVRAVKEGWCAIALEQRDFGECGGNEKGPQCQNPSMTNLLIGRTTIGERVWDVMRCIDALLEKFADIVNPDAIYTLGNSGGGTCSTYCGAMEPRLAGTVPSCAVSSFAASIGAMMHCTCNYVPHILEYFDMSELLAMTAPRRLVVVSGAQDNIFPLAEAKEMVAIGRKAYEAAGVPDRIAHVVGDGGHRFYADIAWDALKKML
ncbi:MAG: hypothetical protein IJ493_11450 [Clostridia bacterium]|nr:hypothetical protein [Clostridia bacterium]